MRITVVLLTFLLVSGCSAMMLGGGSSTNAASSAKNSADATITAQIHRNFAADSTVAAYNLGVRSIAGNVTLTGRVKDYKAREQAGRLAKASDGVKTVSNQIVVEN